MKRRLKQPAAVDTIGANTGIENAPALADGKGR